ncbi:MAG: PEP-CTERM sorting domain-containing protein [Verrucomicrobiales bacterium]
MKTIPLLLGLSIMTGGAHAAIVYSGVQNIPIPYTFAGIYVNPLTLATSTTEPVSFNSSPWINFGFGGVDISNGDLLTPVVVAGDVVENLFSLTLVDSSLSFTLGASASSTHMGTGAGQFQASTSGYLGFSFRPTVGGSTHYGWAQVTLRDDGSAGDIVAWAYENIPSTAIPVGVVPEPSSSLLLALLGLLSCRRKRYEIAPLR